MKRYTVYINNETEDILRAKSVTLGLTLNEVIRRQLSLITEKGKHEDRLEQLESKIDSIYAALQLIAGDLGYIAGATRASTKSHDTIRIEGITHESSVKRTLDAIGKQFNRQEVC